MKKLPALFFCAVACTITFLSCVHNDRDINLSFNDSDHYYSMKAYFSKNKTRDIEHYLDSKIGRRSNMSFVNSQIDGKLALDDHTTFYIKKSPGLLKIKFDKSENSNEAYERIRSMCEGIKKVLN
jgi:hypothetical protein